MTDKRRYPQLVDLCCGAGGATRGYQRAGFYVVGVDNRPQPHYCGDEFHQADALTFDLAGFDAVHASPPCQRFANVTRWRGTPADHPDLLAPMLERLRAQRAPWVVENVPEAIARPDLILCGSSFGLAVRRHRHFLTSWPSFGLIAPCRHGDLMPFAHKAERATCSSTSRWRHDRGDDMSEREFVDSHGTLRRGNQWGFNSHVTLVGAQQYARAALRRGRHIWVWRLPDGTYDWSGTSDPPLDATRPFPTVIDGAELIEEMVT